MQVSILRRLFLSLFLLLIAGGVTVVNFNSIAGPMSEMVGGNTMIGAFQISEIAAFNIVVIEISMGLFLMEALRKTRIFPIIIGALPNEIRIWMACMSGGFLLALASVETGLIYMREFLRHMDLAAEAAVRGDAAAAAMSGNDWTMVVAQMAFAFLVPLVTPLVAYPLETFLYALRGKSPPGRDTESPVGVERRQLK